MVFSITEMLNLWAEMGVFSYVIPFLLIFAIVFAILQKTNILGDNKIIQAIVGVAVGLLALINDRVPLFFANLFPKFGIGLAIFLVLIILIGFFFPSDESKLQWIGWITGIGVVLWAIVNWTSWTANYTISAWFGENFWALVFLAVVILVIVLVVKSGTSGAGSSRRGAHGIGRGP